MRLCIAVVVFAFAMAGCATTIPPDLTASATSATSAAGVAHSVNDEILRARLLRLVQGDAVLMAPANVPAALVCIPSSASVELSAKELGAYADAINSISKVATKPTDVSYGGYLQQFKKNQAVIDSEPSSPDEASAKDAKDTKDAQKRCETFLAADIGARLTAPAPGANALAFAGAEAAVVSVDGLIRAILAGAEQVQRDVAIHRAMTHLAATLTAATAKLSAAPSSADYVLQEPSEQPASILANTLAIHRWFAAQRLQADWTRLKAVNGAPDPGLMWQAVDTFVADVEAYVTLSSTDPNATVDKLKAAVAKAAQINATTSIGDIFDTLSALGSAASAISEKYAVFRKTIN